MLESIWFFLWGILWAVYFMLDGFDLGVGILLPFLGKNEAEKKILTETIKPFWDGNEVWLITAGGVTFAAFPAAYAAIFSVFYTPLMFILFALIIRAVGLEMRNKFESSSSRLLADSALFVGSLLPAVLFGVAFANIFRGVPINKTGVFEGNLLTFLTPYCLAGGLLFLALFLLHGALWLAARTDGDIEVKAISAAKAFWIATLVFAIIFLLFTPFQTALYGNYLAYPVLFIIPVAAVIALLATRLYMGGSRWKAWWASSITIVMTTLFGVVGLYPNLLPSRLDKAFSLTISNAASSPLTLKIMLVVALVFVPIVIIYQSAVYRLFREKITEKGLGEDIY